MKKLSLRTLILSLLCITIQTRANSTPLQLPAGEDPVITWSTPWSINYGTALGSGTFTYDPPAGTMLNAGDAQVLSLNFVPDDPEAYNSVSSFVNIDVDKGMVTARADDKTMREGARVPKYSMRPPPSQPQPQQRVSQETM